MRAKNHESLIRQCYDLARQAVANGDHPFGALLVYEGEVVLTAVNTVHSNHDVTRHAELNLVSQASRLLSYTALTESLLYTSTEPCAMCAGAIVWAGIRAIVYGCSGTSLGQITGGTFVVPSRQLLAKANQPIQIVGPVLEAEGFAIHQDYWPSYVNPFV
jgi:tRNA(Arg) A34 adenosine deaminase TadA